MSGRSRWATLSTPAARACWALTAWFLGTRLALFTGLSIAAHRDHRGLAPVLSVFDGDYYRIISGQGYPAVLPRGALGVMQNPVAFFPLFPAVVAPLRNLGLSFEAAATVVTTVAGLVATLLTFQVVRRYRSDRVACLTAALWSVQPLGFVLSLTYAEALYAALAVSCLLAVLCRRWLVAGLLAALASGTRPTGVILGLILALAVALAWRELNKRDRISGVVACALAPTGFLAYLAYLWVHTGDLKAWFVTERQGWGVYTDGGRETARRFWHYLLHPAERPAATAVSLFLIVVVVLAIAMLRERTPVLVVLLPMLTLLLALTTRNAYSSIPRFLLPASFPLLVPVAGRVDALWRTAHARKVSRVSVAGLALAATMGMIGAGIYLTTVSTYPP